MRARSSRAELASQPRSRSLPGRGSVLTRRMATLAREGQLYATERSRAIWNAAAPSRAIACLLSSVDAGLVPLPFAGEPGVQVKAASRSERHESCARSTASDEIRSSAAYARPWDIEYSTGSGIVVNTKTVFAVSAEPCGPNQFSTP